MPLVAQARLRPARRSARSGSWARWSSASWGLYRGAAVQDLSRGDVVGEVRASFTLERAARP